jgi:pyruvate/2-oxoglutarate/acetoin dehydrogenase E1 component
MSTKYLQEINRSMKLLAEHPNVIFIGQSVEYPGTAITHQIKNLQCKKLEMPVAEDFQAGFCLGLSLRGKIPICIYPRFNFALLAANQIINHIDKYGLITEQTFIPKIIIKIAIGSNKPLDPGHQHKANYTTAFRSMCDTIDVIELTHSFQIFDTYKYALNSRKSTIIIEHSYNYAYEPEWEQ